MNRSGQPNQKKPSPAVLFERELKRVEKRERFRQTVHSTTFSLAVAAAIAVLVATLLLPVLQIYGASMAPTLAEGEIAVAVKTGSVSCNDLVAFYYGNKVLVKRCVAVGGDYVTLDADGTVSVNGEILEEPYLTEKVLGDCDLVFPYRVPDGRYFVLGDQRKTSIDSRNALVGCIASEQIVGRIVFRIWPLSRVGPIR